MGFCIRFAFVYISRRVPIGLCHSRSALSTHAASARSPFNRHFVLQLKFPLRSFSATLTFLGLVNNCAVWMCTFYIYELAHTYTRVQVLQYPWDASIKYKSATKFTYPLPFFRTSNHKILFFFSCFQNTRKRHNAHCAIILCSSEVARVFRNWKPCIPKLGGHWEFRL